MKALSIRNLTVNFVFKFRVSLSFFSVHYNFEVVCSCLALTALLHAQCRCAEYAPHNNNLDVITIVVGLCGVWLNFDSFIYKVKS